MFPVKNQNSNFIVWRVCTSANWSLLLCCPILYSYSYPVPLDEWHSSRNPALCRFCGIFSKALPLAAALTLLGYSVILKYPGIRLWMLSTLPVCECCPPSPLLRDELSITAIVFLLSCYHVPPLLRGKHLTWRISSAFLLPWLKFLVFSFTFGWRPDQRLCVNSYLFASAFSFSLSEVIVVTFVFSNVMPADFPI